MAVPDYAAVAETVEQARWVAGKAMAGLVNGVLRSVVRAGEDPSTFPDRTSDPAAFLAAWHAHPRWLVERWLEAETEQRVEALLESNNRVPSVYLRPLGSSAASAARELGVEEGPAGPEGLCVRIPSDVTTEDALARIRGIVQDPAAAVVTRYADVPDGALVADLCAAPGGKAFAMAEEAGYVVALDRSRDRLARLVETRERLQSAVAVVTARAEAPPLKNADLVLVDVPCSGTGTLRRHPDLKWRLQPESITSLVRLQRTILDGAARVVSAGGVLVYATCTLEREENEGQVEAFLKRHKDFEVESTSVVSAVLEDESGHLKIDPRDHDCDGAFAARMRRIR
jgi:16S rRNA (cytosine967-C5)-methyltransferase